MSEETHICSGYEVNYMRGTPAGRGSPCRHKAKHFRDGKWYCGIHDPEKIKEREARREQRSIQKEKAKMKTWGFKVGDRIYDVEDETEQGAWQNLFGKVIEVEHLGELKKQRQRETEEK